MPPRKRSNWRQPTVFDDVEGGRRTTRAARSSAGGYSSRSVQSTRDGVTINISRSKERVKGWIEVWRRPAKGIGFKIPMWVQIDKLTPAEKEEVVAEHPEMASKIFPQTEKSKLATPSSIATTHLEESEEVVAMQVDTPTAATGIPLQEQGESAPVLPSSVNNTTQVDAEVVNKVSQTTTSSDSIPGNVVDPAVSASPENVAAPAATDAKSTATESCDAPTNQQTLSSSVASLPTAEVARKEAHAPPPAEAKDPGVVDVNTVSKDYAPPTGYDVGGFDDPMAGIS